MWWSLDLEFDEQGLRKVLSMGTVAVATTAQPRARDAFHASCPGVDRVMPKPIGFRRFPGRSGSVPQIAW